MNNKTINILKWVFFSLMVIINGFVIYQACLPANSSSSWSNVVVDVVSKMTGGSITPETSSVIPGLNMGDFIRKFVGHLSLFLVDGVISYMYFRYLSITRKFDNYLVHVLYSLALGIFISSITEIIQLFIPGRSGDIIDVLIDLLGYLLGMGLTMLIYFIINNFKQRKLIKNNI